jgi:hypothetical protein
MNESEVIPEDRPEVGLAATRLLLYIRRIKFKIYKESIHMRKVDLWKGHKQLPAEPTSRLLSFRPKFYGMPFNNIRDT